MSGETFSPHPLKWFNYSPKRYLDLVQEEDSDEQKEYRRYEQITYNVNTSLRGKAYTTA